VVILGYFVLIEGREGLRYRIPNFFDGFLGIQINKSSIVPIYLISEECHENVLYILQPLKNER